MNKQKHTQLNRINAPEYMDDNLCDMLFKCTTILIKFN